MNYTQGLRCKGVSPLVEKQRSVWPMTLSVWRPPNLELSELLSQTFHVNKDTLCIIISIHIWHKQGTSILGFLNYLHTQ